jgi:uncharacterized protein DUF6916
MDDPDWRDRPTRVTVGEAPSGMDLGMNQTTGLTRRSLLCAGATAGAAVALGVRPWTAAAAGPGYLTRSSYTGLEGTSFTVETGAKPVVLKLESVSDLAGAASGRALVGSEDAFALSFSGPIAAPLDSGIHTLHHPSIGSFELFSSPVDAPEDDRHYEVVIDRSVGVPQSHSDAPKAPETPRTETREPEPEPKPEVEPKPEAALVRRASLRRAGRWARCEVVLARSVDAQRVRGRLLRKGKLVASASRAVADQRAVLRFESAQRLVAGTYTLAVTAFDADGKATSQRVRVTLR